MSATLVVLFDCGEAIVVYGLTEAEAWEVRDDRGCAPVGVYPPARVVLRGEPWTKNGLMRCQVERMVDAA